MIKILSSLTTLCLTTILVLLSIAILRFRFTVPLFIRSQHHRHRTWAYNEISRRYTSIDMKFYTPTSFRSQHESNRQASTELLTNPIVYCSGHDHSFEMNGPATNMVRNHHAISLVSLRVNA